MNRNVGQAFQHAGLPDFPVRWTKDGRLESRPNPQAGKPALRASPGSWPQCMRKNGSGLSMNLPSLRIAAALEKAAQRTHALQTLRDCQRPWTARSAWSASDVSALSLRAGGQRFIAAIQGSKLVEAKLRRCRSGNPD